MNKKLLYNAWPVLAIVIAVAYFLAMKFNFDPVIEHFTADSVWFWVFTVAAGAAAVLAAVLAIVSAKTVEIVKVPAPTAISIFAAMLSIIMAIGVFIFEIGDKSPALGGVQKLGTVLTLFIPLSFALSCVEKYRTSVFHRLAAILAALSVNLIMFARYFDFSHPLNGPVRNVTTIMHCAILLFLLSELRLSFGISSKKVTAAFYVFSSAIGASVALGFALGNFMFSVSAHDNGNLTESLLRLGLYFAVALFAGSRISTLTAVSAPASGGAEK